MNPSNQTGRETIGFRTFAGQISDGVPGAFIHSFGGGGRPASARSEGVSRSRLIPAIVKIDVSDPRRVGIYDVARALFFRGGLKFGEHRAIENYRMAAMAIVARDHYRLARLIVPIDYRRERFGAHHRMVSQMHQRA